MRALWVRELNCDKEAGNTNCEARELNCEKEAGNRNCEAMPKTPVRVKRAWLCRKAQDKCMHTR